MKKNKPIITGLMIASLISIQVVYAQSWTASGGGDHSGADWSLVNGEEIAGVHTGIRNFTIGETQTNFVTAYDGTQYGKVEIHAETITIDDDSALDAIGRGYGGGGGGGGGGGSGLDWSKDGVGGARGYGIQGSVHGNFGKHVGNDLEGGYGGDGGDGAGPYGGQGGGGGHGGPIYGGPTSNGGVGTNGAFGQYCAGNTIDCDLTTDLSINMGSGGGGSGGGGGGGASTNFGTYTGGGGGGGAAGANGGGAVLLFADNINISGSILAKGEKGNYGSPGGSADQPEYGGIGGAGGNAGSAWFDSIGDGGWGDADGDYRNSQYQGGNGGGRSAAAGGGVLIKGYSVDLSGAVIDTSDSYQGSNIAGTLKIFYSGTINHGSYTVGRTYTNEIPDDRESGTIFTF